MSDRVRGRRWRNVKAEPERSAGAGRARRVGVGLDAGVRVGDTWRVRGHAWAAKTTASWLVGAPDPSGGAMATQMAGRTGVRAGPVDARCSQVHPDAGPVLPGDVALALQPPITGGFFHGVLAGQAALRTGSGRPAPRPTEGVSRAPEHRTPHRTEADPAQRTTLSLVRCAGVAWRPVLLDPARQHRLHTSRTHTPSPRSAR